MEEIIKNFSNIENSGYIKKSAKYWKVALFSNLMYITIPKIMI